MTTPETLMWARLRGNQLLGVSFRRQEPVGPYIADFLSHSKKIVVEIDGHTHGAPITDTLRDHWFASAGFRTLRFSNVDIMENIEGVLATIAREIEETRTPTLPSRQVRANEVVIGPCTREWEKSQDPSPACAGSKVGVRRKDQ